MEKAIIISRCSTNENKQDVNRQSEELISNYGNTYEIIKEFGSVASNLMKNQIFYIYNKKDVQRTLFS